MAMYDDAVYRKLIASQIFFDDGEDQSWVLVDEGVNHVEDMSSIVSCIVGIIGGHEYRESKYKRNTLGYFGQMLLSSIRIDSKEIIRYFDGNYISPYFGAFDRARDKLKSDMGLWHSTVSDKPDARQAYQAVELFVKNVKEETDGPEFRSYMKNNLRARMKNIESVRKFMNSLYVQTPDLQVVKLNLGYNSKYLSSLDVAHDVKRVKSDFSRFLKIVKSKYGKNSCFGYVWKLGFCGAKCFSYEFFLFLDGSVFKNATAVARELGEVWKNGVTEGDGAYLNYNRHDNGSERSPVGLVSVGVGEDLRVQNLYFDLYSLVKLDLLVRPSAIGVGRTLGKSCVRKI